MGHQQQQMLLTTNMGGAKFNDRAVQRETTGCQKLRVSGTFPNLPKPGDGGKPFIPSNSPVKSEVRWMTTHTLAGMPKTNVGMFGGKTFTNLLSVAQPNNGLVSLGMVESGCAIRTRSQRKQKPNRAWCIQ
jgi:hypothetical protein